MRIRHEGERATEEKWARDLFRTQSGVDFRLYVKCRAGEEVCEKRGLSLRHFLSFFFFVIMSYLF